MIKPFFISILFCFCFTGCSSQQSNKQQQDDCQCSNEEQIFSLLKGKTVAVSVCGTVDKEMSGNKKLVVSPVVTDCLNDTTLLDYSDDEIYKYVLTLNNNQITISSTQIVLKGDNWEYNVIEDVERSIYLSTEGIKISDSKNIFNPPVLTNKQKNDLDELCTFLKKDANIPKKIYPGDEKSIYMLYIGALNNHAESKYLLHNLQDLFELDGAIAETYSEVNP